MKAILRSINNFSCKLKQSNNLKYNISPKIRSNKFKNISGNGNIVIEDAIDKNAKDYKIYGNTYQNSTSGKNLFDKDTTNVLNAYFDSSHINITADTTNKVIYLPCKPSTTYSITQGASSLSNHLLQIGTTNTKPEIGTTTYSFEDHRNDLTFTYITSSTAKYIIIRLRNGDYTDSTYMSTVQLEEGSSATSYEPYTGGQPSPNPDYPQEIVSCGDRTKNLFDKNNANIINGYIQGNTGKIILGNSDLIAYIKCKPNTQYSFQRMQIIDNKGRLRIGTTQTIPIADMAVENFYYKGNSEYSTNKLDGYTTGANAEYLLFYFSQISGMSQNEIDTILSSIQIEENSIATSHEPYGYKIPINVNNSITNIYLDEPLRKIGEYSDYIDFANGKIVRKIKEIILDGSLSNNFNNPTINNNTIRFDIQNILLGSLRSNQNKIICDKFISLYGNNNDYEHIRNTNTSYNNVLIVYINKIRLNLYTREEFINWLSSNPVTVDYVLETPTIEDIGLPNINLIEGKNIITIGTELESIIEVEYYSKEIIDISNYKYNLRKVED